ncbi:MAG: class I SAM-dependent methyltransferase [Gammaproteobacteria bacterium]|nr:class I SAM-dependent methyltransferase [Gammaproteobacteria bacterium]
MYIKVENIERFCEEPEIFNELIALDDKHVLELGCGRADLTRTIASNGAGRKVTAYEIDEIQHGKNLEITDLPNVTFKHGAAESIAEEDNSADVAFMFKSLHHVPLDAMDAAFDEIQRVLKASGKLYVSEPIFAGEFNEILRMFHNEESVRAAAFEAEKRAISSGKFKLAKQVFFNAPMHFPDFEAFEKLVLGVTHTDFNLTDELFEEVKQKFLPHLGDEGAHFRMPIRVDLLEVVK